MEVLVKKQFDDLAMFSHSMCTLPYGL